LSAFPGSLWLPNDGKAVSVGNLRIPLADCQHVIGRPSGRARLVGLVTCSADQEGAKGRPLLLTRSGAGRAEEMHHNTTRQDDPDDGRPTEASGSHFPKSGHEADRCPDPADVGAEMRNLPTRAPVQPQVGYRVKGGQQERIGSPVHAGLPLLRSVRKLHHGQYDASLGSLTPTRRVSLALRVSEEAAELTAGLPRP